MYKIIDLDIDGTLTGDTRVSEIAMVESPAIEQNFIYFAEEKSYVVPQNVASKACKARRYKDKEGTSCGSRIGWTRSSQLCDRKPISLETVKRMYSFFSRHSVNQKEGLTYDEGCHAIMWDAWGGTPGYEWSKRIVEREQEMDIDVSGLPEYVNYPTGDTENDMLIEDVGFIDKIPYERKEDYISRCVEWHIKNKGWSRDQSYAVCIQQANQAFARGQRVSFDYDVLNTPKGRGLALSELQSGSEVYVVGSYASMRMKPLAEELGIDDDNIYSIYQDDNLVRWVRLTGITRHYTDKDNILDELGRIGQDFNCPCFDEYNLEDACWEGYEPIGTKIKDGREVPNCVPIEASKVALNADFDIYGYKPSYFDICPGAIETFKHLVEMNVDEETQGMIRSAAQIADNVFKIEKEVIKKEKSTSSELEEAIILVDDFKDLMREIDELTNMTHNVDYMDGHIKVIRDYLTQEEFVSIDGCECIEHKDGQGNCVYVPRETEPVEEQAFGIDEYSDDEKQAAVLLKELKDRDTEAFERIVGELRGASKAQLRRRNHTSPTAYYLYKRIDSGEPTRDFCDSIEGRYFRRFEIDLLRDSNREFGHNRLPYSKWIWKGGPNCVHGWIRVIVTGGNIREAGAVPGLPGTPPKRMPNQGYYSEETKRRSQIAYIIEQKRRGNFAAEKEKRMVYSPLMIPNILIPRLDENDEKYFVRFTPESIEKMQQLYMIEKRQDKTNYEHTEKKIPSVVMVESWIVSGENDKAYELGFKKDDIPVGTWMGGFKVMDTEEGDLIWNDFIKTGKLKGFSVEGDFLLKFSRQKTDEYLLEEIINTLKSIND